MMLLAGSITSIMTYLQEYELKDMLPILLAALIVFYVLGLAVRKVLNLFVIPAEEPKVEDGAVIEKEVEAEENQDGQAGEQ